MTRLLFWGGSGVVCVLAAATGWVVGTPRPVSNVQPPRWMETPFTRVTPETIAAQEEAEAKEAAAVGEDPGDAKTRALRARLASTLAQVTASPCDPGARAAFTDAYSDRTGAIMDAGNAGNGERPPVWSSNADLKADHQIEALTKAGYFTEDELGMAFLQKRMGEAEIARLQQQSGGSGPTRSTRCATAPTAQS